MSALRAWQEVIHLFEKHGLAPPPVPLRDELVTWLLAYRARLSELSATSPSGEAVSAGNRATDEHQ